MELEDLKKTWKSVEPHIEKASTGTSDIPDLESKPIIKRDYYGVASSVLPFLW